MRIGAVLDRNGLRPSRYTVTKDGLVVMASETGVLDIAPENVAHKGRLQPGRMFLIDTVARPNRAGRRDQGDDGGAASRTANGWTEPSHDSIASGSQRRARVESFEADELLKQQQSFGYTIEDLKMILAPMATNGQEPVGSMGTDTPLAVLSNKSQPLYNYFKQLFAQVTNPPIDPIREELVTSTETTIGAGGESVRGVAATLPSASTQAADSHQRGTRKDQTAERRRPANHHAANALPRRGW